MGFGHKIAAFDEEESERTMSDRVLLSRLVSYVLVYKRRFVVCLVLVILATITTLVMPFLWKIAIDDYIVPFSEKKIAATVAMNGLLWISIAYLIITLSSYVVNVFRGYLLNWIGHNIMRDLRNQMFAHLQRMSKSFYDNSEVGILMSKVTSDVETMSEVLATGLVTVFSDVLLLAAILVLMFMINVELTLYALLTVPMLLGVAMVFRQFARRAYRRTRKKIAGVMSNLQETISGIRVAQSFSRESKNAKRFDQINVENLEANVYAAQIFSLFFPVIEIIGAIGIAVVLFFGGKSVIVNRMDLGVLFLFQALVMRFFHPIMSLTMFYNSIQSAFAAAERIFGLLETPPDIIETEGAEELSRIEGRVDFNDVTFGYVSGLHILEDFKLAVHPKERLAIVGPTGAGKSTVMNLLLRFHDVSKGSVMVDGHDIRGMSLSSLRRNMAIVLQDTFLFSGTIADNIRFGKPEASDEDVRAAAKVVGADDFISRLPEEYDTVVTERGGNLSTGQRQLVSFARALLVDPPILLLDEATSSVDPYTELLIQNALKKLLRNRTSIVIAHRLSTVRNAERIVVMDHGKIVEEGRHEELIARGEMYKKLCEMQLMSTKTRPD